MTAEPRSYYRHVHNGEKGYLVDHGGRLAIRLDRPGDTVERTYRASDWIPEVERRELSPMVLARICWQADQELCVGLGLMQRKEWLNLPESKRVEWMAKGPVEPDRRILYDAIMGALRELNAAR